MVRRTVMRCWTSTARGATMIIVTADGNVARPVFMGL